MKTIISLAALLVSLFVIAWLFRHEYLPPIEYKELSSQDNPLGRSVVVCSGDRWLNTISCETVPVHDLKAVKEMEEWAEKQGQIKHK